MIVKPSSALATSPIAYPPCLKHFWKCNETSGSVLSDAVGGVSLLPYTVFTYGTDASGVPYVFPNVGTGAGSYSGTLTNPLTKAAVLFAVANFNAGNFALGVGATDRLGLIQNGNNLVSDASGAYPPSGGVAFTSTAGVWGRAIAINAWNNATGLTPVESDTSATYNSLTAVSLSGDTTFSFSSGTWQCPSTVTALYGAALFIFAGSLPTDLRAAITWMTKQWSLGNKAIYPGWANIA